jgi:hypothetical protein
MRDWRSLIAQVHCRIQTYIHTIHTIYIIYYVYIHTYIHTYCMHTYISTNRILHNNTHTHVYTHIYIYIYIYMHIYTQLEESSGIATIVLNDLINHDKIVIGSFSMELELVSLWSEAFLPQRQAGSGAHLPLPLHLSLRLYPFTDTH